MDNRIALPLAATFLLVAATAALGAVAPVTIDTDGPAEGAVTLDLQELWRVGGEDGEVFFGRIADVARHPDGEILVLDNQLCQVEVFSPGGEHLRTLSRQGDGPGEIRQPTGLVLLPDDVVGIAAGFPAKMVTLEMDGTPIATRYPIGEPSDGKIGVMTSLDTGAGMLAATGGRLVLENGPDSYIDRFLAVGGAGGEGFTRILERRTPLDPTGRFWDEAADYYFDGRWDLGPDGLFYVPMKRDAYEISVFDRTGSLQFVFGRDLEPHRRTDEDKREAGPTIDVAHEPDRDDWDVCEHDEAITRIMLNPDDGTAWVLTPHGADEQPAGVLETWDVFSARGEFLRRVAIPLGDEIREGNCFLVGGGRMVVIRGSGSSYHGDDDVEDDDFDGEIEPLEVICYAIH